MPQQPKRSTALSRLLPLVLMLLAVAATAAAQGDAGARRLVIGVIVPDLGAEPSGLAADVARAAEQGAHMATEEHAFNAELFMMDFEVVVAHASGPEAVSTAAQQLVEEAGAIALAGGFDAAEAAAIGAFAAQHGLPFFNLVASSDALRQEQCSATTFHIAPSAGMYLDALAGWYVRSGFRQWHLVVGDDVESSAQAERAQAALRERHFGVRVVGQTPLAAGADASAVATAVARNGADLIVLLLSADEQLRVLADLSAAGVRTTVAGFPHAEAQSRSFFRAWKEAAQGMEADHRASAWEARLDAYGARELNARYLAAYGEPMDMPAWSAYQAIKAMFEAATMGGSLEPQAVLDYLNNSVFDVWKGIGVSFRPWDRQLRQPLYLVAINDATSSDAFGLATLVGELPAIYMPGTDPVERLDQLGDLQATSRCLP